jgi:hypothetical protein
MPTGCQDLSQLRAGTKLSLDPTTRKTERVMRWKQGKLKKNPTGHNASGEKEGKRDSCQQIPPVTMLAITTESREGFPTQVLTGNSKKRAPLVPRRYRLYAKAGIT